MKKTQRKTVIVILIFILCLALLAAAGLLLLPKINSGGNGIGGTSLFRDEMLQLPIRFQAARSRDHLYTCFESELTLTEMAQAIAEQGLYETELYAREDGTADLLIASRGEDGTVNDWFIRDHGNGVFLIRYEGLWNGNPGGDELLFPNHLLETPDWARDCTLTSLESRMQPRTEANGTTTLEYGAAYPTTGTLEDYREYYAASGKYRMQTEGDSIILLGYSDAAPQVICPELAALNASRRGATPGSGYVYYEVPEFQGPYVITVTETPQGNTVCIRRDVG